MANTTSTEELGERIERLVQQHIAASRVAAQDAVGRAFATATGAAAKPRTRRQVGASNGKRRTRAEMAALAERIYQAVCAKPGETMMVLAADLGASARELHRPMSQLKSAGRVRSVGAKSLTRYFPMTNGAAVTA